MSQQDTSKEKLVLDNSQTSLPDDESLKTTTINEIESRKKAGKKFFVTKVIENLNRNTNNLSADEEETDRFSDDLLDKVKAKILLTNTDLNNRENEGQDTITSLTNNVYKRELIKRKASLNRSSNQNSANWSKTGSINHLSRSSSSSSSSSIEQTPLFAIRSLFRKNSAALQSSRINSVRSSPDHQKPQIPHDSMTSNNSGPIEQQQQQQQQQTSTAAQGASKTDQVFDLIQDALLTKSDRTNPNELDEKRKVIEICLNAVQIEQLKLKKRKDKARKVCLCAELFVFCFVILLGIAFVLSVLNVLRFIKTSQNTNNDNYISRNYSSSQSFNFTVFY